jgi:hypothetical protein
VAKTYEPINSVVLGTSATSISFTSIPQNYSDLVIISNARISGVSGEGVNIQFNSDSSALYSQTRLYSNQSANVSDRGTGLVQTDVAYLVGNDASANLFSPFTIDIVNYKSTTNFKSFFSRWYNPQANQHMGVNAGLYRSTTAITSLNLFPSNGKSFVSGTSVYLYGILAANA